jgi:hypothetical protein
MSARTSLWIGFLAGGWFATLLFVFAPVLLPRDGGLRSAHAEDPPVAPIPIPLPGAGPGAGGPGGSPASPISPGPTVNPINPGFEAKGAQPVPGGGTADSNGRAIALAASIGGGESAVYYFDTIEKRLLVYQYKGIIQGSDPLDVRDKGGLRLLAARHFDYDLKLEGYRDLSQRTRGQLKEAFEATFSAPESRSGQLPTKKVDVQGGLR